MSDKFQPIATGRLAAWMFTELENRNALFGIPHALFHAPAKNDRFASSVCGQSLETPFGVAAGPHSQMARNIIAAWLCGARFIELKTIQTLDELDVSKPCIDMWDEGYNVEWSQELKVRQSFEEYLRAWVLIHALHRKLGFPGDRPGVVFNMSVGYNMEGILKPNVQEFLDRMRDAGEALAACVEEVAAYYPPVRDLDISSRLSDNVTLSTMHGCPPDEIEKISLYLIRDRGLHTNVKMNPTLLGPDALRGILNKQLGFKEITVPDAAFGHDLKYPDAVRIIRNLSAAAGERKVYFGVKLSNTLEVENHRPVFSEKEKMMYMSGRSLHAVTVNLAARLADEFKGGLALSFSAGADAFNVPHLLAGGMRTITVCSDLLRTGGYLRMTQYLGATTAAMKEVGAETLDEFIVKTCVRNGLSRSADINKTSAAHLNLRQYAETVAGRKEYRRSTYDRARTKTQRPLGFFDCIMAPCTEDCPVDQKVPQYMRLVRDGRLDEAITVVRDDNPLPAILGRACNHYCERVCVRAQLDEPLAIREMKRFIMDQEKAPHFRKRMPDRDAPVAIIGGGPCGLASAYFLRQAGYPVTIFEARAYPGGMVSGSIPGYRAIPAVIEQDLKIVRDLGVDLRFNQQAGRDFTIADLRKQGFRFVIVAAGAQKGLPLGVEGEDSEGVFDGLDFLRLAREQRVPKLGARVGVIGGGDVAMDCARTAARLTGGQTTIIYRRTIDQMPAQREEIDGMLEEGINVVELAAPRKVMAREGRLTALRCSRMQLGAPDASGRRRPVEVPGSEFDIALDHLIVAIGQKAQLDFLSVEGVRLNKKGYIEVESSTMETSVPDIFAGGDAVMDGPETIVKALGDGRKMVRAIRERVEGVKESEPDAGTVAADKTDLIRRKALRIPRVPVRHLPPADRKGFEEIIHTLKLDQAREEAARCLECDRYCGICAGVCPNRAILSYDSDLFAADLPAFRKENGKAVAGERTRFAVNQVSQIAILTDFCNECGNCATFCPTAGKPYRDKPRLYLNRDEFLAQPDNAFMAFCEGKKWAMQARWQGATHTLVIDNGLRYRAPGFSAALDPVTLTIREVSFAADVPEQTVVRLEPCAIMFRLLVGIRDSLPYLPLADSSGTGVFEGKNVV